jgi:anaerobic magnesium-protoporphyrin IX monomethyl ester cyclase
MSFLKKNLSRYLCITCLQWANGTFYFHDVKDKILVINPPSRFFPLGMAYVLASLEQHGIEFDFTDAELGGNYKNLLKKNDYYAIATGGLLFHYKFYDDVFQSARRINPDIPVILGGNITKDLRPEFLFGKLHITYGIIGEAETSLPFLIHAIVEKKTGLDSIPGLLYKDPNTGEIRKNPVRRLNLATENILPAWHLVDVDYYVNEWEHSIYGRRQCMPVIASRGCTGTCSFCSPTIGSYSKRPVAQVIGELSLLHERYTFEWVYFVNEMFYPTKEEVWDFCEAYKSANLRKKWVCELRVDTNMDVDTFRLMKSAGCVAVVGGVESGSNKILSLMNKRTTREMIIKFYRNAEAAGLPSEGTFMVGNEGETAAEIKETIDMVISEKMRVNERLPITYPGTKIYENAVNRGLIVHEWEYLQRLNFFADIWDSSWQIQDHLNISDIPNNRFLETIISELRRFNTSNLMRFVPKNMTYSYKFRILIKITGFCAECGSAVTFVTPRKMLGIRTFCRECFRPVEFNVYEMPEFSGHYRFLCAGLQSTKKLVIIGTAAGAINFLKYDYFKINYHSLAAVVEVDGKASGFSCFYHLPRIRMEGLPDVQPDTILIVDDQSGNAELKIRRFYLKKNMQPPQILHILPDKKRPNALVVGLARRLCAVTFWNKFLMFSATQLPIAIAELQLAVITMVKTNYEALNKNAFFRMLVKKVQVHR